MMKRCSALFLAVVSIGCSGNWSNEDIAYSTAVPRRLRFEALGAYAIAPTDAGSKVLNEYSEAFVLTATAGSSYDALLDDLLRATDAAARQPDTRTERSRTWSPISLIADSTFTYSMTSTLLDGGTMEWVVSAKPASGGDSFEVGKGTFTPDGSVIDGVGEANFQVSGYPATFTKDAGYFQGVTAAKLSYTYLGKTVTATTTLTLATGQRIYRFRNLEDGSSRFEFEAKVGGATQFMRTGWTSAGAGVLASYPSDDAGTNDYLALDCWDANSKVVYHAEPPDASVNVIGKASDCAFPVPLKP